MSWIDRRLDELAEEGYFDDLPGSGKPLPDLEVNYSPTWWATRWLERDAAIQDAASLRGHIRQDVEAALNLPRPQARRRLTELLSLVVKLNHHLDSANQLPVFDVDDLLIRGHWH